MAARQGQGIFLFNDQFLLVLFTGTTLRRKILLAFSMDEHFCALLEAGIFLTLLRLFFAKNPYRIFFCRHYFVDIVKGVLKYTYLKYTKQKLEIEIIKIQPHH